MLMNRNVESIYKSHTDLWKELTITKVLPYVMMYSAYYRFLHLELDILYIQPYIDIINRKLKC